MKATAADIEREIGRRADAMRVTVAGLLCHEMTRQKVTRAEMARRIGVAPPRVTRMLDGRDNMQIDTMVEIAAVLGKTWHVALV